MAKRKRVTLVAPNGNKHTLSDPVQIVNLKARGYSVEVPRKAVEPKPVEHKAVAPEQNK